LEVVYIIAILAFVDILFPVGYYLWGVPLLIVAAYVLSVGDLGVLAVVLSCATGSFAGANANYCLGRFGGERIHRSKRVSEALKGKAARLISEHSLALLSFLIAMRFTAITRPSSAIACGILRIQFRKFIIFELAACFLWVSFWVTVALVVPHLFDLSVGKILLNCFMAGRFRCN